MVLVRAVPVVVVRRIRPVAAAGGTITITDVAEGVPEIRIVCPLSTTDLTVNRFKPVMTTVPPATAVVGTNEVIVWAEAATGKNNAKPANAARRNKQNESEEKLRLRNNIIGNNKEADGRACGNFTASAIRKLPQAPAPLFD